MTPEHAARMRAGLDAWRKRERAAAVERVRRFRAWNDSLSTVSHAEVMHGWDSPEAAAARERHRLAWFGRTFPMPSAGDFEVIDT